MRLYTLRNTKTTNLDTEALINSFSALGWEVATMTDNRILFIRTATQAEEEAIIDRKMNPYYLIRSYFPGRTEP